MRARQQGLGKHNQTIMQGERVSGFNKSSGEIVTGEIEGFLGGNHQDAVIRSRSGYKYLVETRTIGE